MSDLDFNKLGAIKRQIVSRAYRQPYVGMMTYEKEKRSLMKKGWLWYEKQGNEITNRVVLTEAGRKAYETRE